MSARHSEEMIASIADLAHGGLSASQVAAKFGTSRNVIVGLAFRNGIKFDGPRNLGGRPKMEPKLKCQPIPADSPDEPSELITFEDLRENSCRFPSGDRDYLFCGKSKLASLPYCARHCRIAYAPR